MNRKTLLPILFGALVLAACNTPQPAASSSTGVSSSDSSSEVSSSESSDTGTSSSSSSDPNAWTRTKIRDALKALEYVGLKGSFRYDYALATVGTITEYFNSEGYYGPDLYYLRSEMIDGGAYDYESRWFYKTADGKAGEKYLDRDNTVKEAVYDYNFEDNFIHPFAALQLSHITFDQSLLQATITIPQSSPTYPYNELMYLTIHMSYGYFWEPDYFTIQFDEDLNPLSLIAYGYYSTGMGTSQVAYSGQFVGKEDLQIADPVPYESQEGQEGLASLLSALQNATSYSASMSSTRVTSESTTTVTADLKVVEGKGVVETSEDGTVVGTYAEGTGYYTIDGGEGSVAHASSALLEGDAIVAYFDENDYEEPLTPDFAVSEKLFSVDADGSYTFVPKELHDVLYYLCPDTSWANLTTHSSSGEQVLLPLIYWIDYGTFKVSGSLESGIVVSYEANDGEYRNSVTITGLNATEYPYTSISTAA